MTNVYDGKLWKDWKSYLDIPECRLVQTIQAFALQCWSNILRIQNLPHSIRFKPENIIIEGTIPGTREPKLTINSHLQSMVDGARTNRVALCCISSDIPATRKLCFLWI